MEELLVEQKVYKLFPSQLQDAKPFETLSTPPENLLQAFKIIHYSSLLSCNLQAININNTIIKE